MRRSARPDYRLKAWSSPVDSIFPHFFLDLFTWCHRLSFSTSETKRVGRTCLKLNQTSHCFNRTLMGFWLAWCSVYFSVLLNGFTCWFLSLGLNPAFPLFIFCWTSETACLYSVYFELFSRRSYTDWHIKCKLACEEDIEKLSKQGNCLFRLYCIFIQYLSAAEGFNLTGQKELILFL